MNSTWSTEIGKTAGHSGQHKQCVHCEATERLFFGGMDNNGQVLYVCKEALDQKLDLTPYGVVDDDLFLPQDWRKA
jgi:hypothetical protein